MIPDGDGAHKGGEPELAGDDPASLLHPDDVDALVRSAHDPARRFEAILVRVRLRHPTRGWVETPCLLFPLPEADKIPAACTDSGPEGEAIKRSDRDRIATLELHLQQFAAELHTGNWRDIRPLGVNVAHIAALDRLPKRQLEIVDRLLRGERIPTIATSLYISASTVRNHLTHVFAAFGVHSQGELLALLRTPEA